MKILCVIPARYASKRFPGKPLVNIDGSPMIKWVYQRAKSANIFNKIIVATDDQRIFDTVLSFGGEAEMTPSELPSGTDRVSYVAKNEPADIVVNLQGDEPLIPTNLLHDVCQPFKDEKIDVTTAIKKISTAEEIDNPNIVKVVIDKDKNALYFSRATVPFSREKIESKKAIDKIGYYKHIGIYTYRKKFLLNLTELPQSSLESVEKLEQLRILENGYKIYTVITDYDSLSVDTPGDLEKVKSYIRINHIRVEENNEKM